MCDEASLSLVYGEVGLGQENVWNTTTYNYDAAVV